LQQQFQCNIILGGDFNSTVGHLEKSMNDFKNTTFKPDSIANHISSKMTDCDYIHPFESIVYQWPAREYLTFQCYTNVALSSVSSKGIDHFLFPRAMLVQLENLCVSDNFFAGSKHKTVTISIKNLVNLPINTQQNIKQFIPFIVWNNPEFSNCSKLIYSQYLSDHKEMNNSNWDTLMGDISKLWQCGRKRRFCVL
jgi:hypothetical protein